MIWEKLGRIFNPDDYPEIVSHAQVPTVLLLEDRFRVYFSPRDAQGQSYTAFIDLEREDPTRLMHVNLMPVLERGKPGTFDEDGVMPGYVMNHGDETLLFYSGWNQKVRTPYHNATGMAKSTDNGQSFDRVYEGPILDRIPTEPYLAVTPTILFDGGIWKMWYISGLFWTEVDDKYEPVYAIKYAVSDDLVNWHRHPQICVAQKHSFEAFSHPTVLKENRLFKMWYCFRGSHDYRGGSGSYRIGYAESRDGVDWQRKDELAGITVSDRGWDSEMICYPFVLEDSGKVYMFYNGNGFGKTGIGIARRES